MASNILITGGGGFLGRSIAKYFSQHGWTVSAIGHAVQDFSPMDSGISRWRNADVEPGTLKEFFQEPHLPQVVVHCAGSGSVGRSWDAPFDDFQRTTLTTAALIDTVRKHAPHALLIYPSSAAVYGQSDESKLTEASELHPMSPYGLHKLAAEDLCLGAQRIFGLRVALIRFFSLYGPGLRKQLLWDTARKLADGGNSLTLDGSGKELRDFLHVEDAARLVWHLSEQPAQSEPVIVNGATGVGTSVAAVAELLMEAMGRQSVDLQFSGRCRPGDPARLVGDVQKLERLGFQPAFGVREGVRQFAASLTSLATFSHPGVFL
jgi:UDP-glucose 4-epimerase